MAYKAMPYRGAEYGFPKVLPENLPAAGFEGWIIQEGYPHSLITDIPGFPEGTGWFCHCYDDENTFSPYHPDNPNHVDPYVYVEPPPPSEEETPPEPVVATSFTTNTVST